MVTTPPESLLFGQMGAYSNDNIWNWSGDRWIPLREPDFVPDSKIITFTKSSFHGLRPTPFQKFSIKIENFDDPNKTTNAIFTADGTIVSGLDVYDETVGDGSEFVYMWESVLSSGEPTNFTTPHKMTLDYVGEFDISNDIGITELEVQHALDGQEHDFKNLENLKAIRLYNTEARKVVLPYPTNVLEYCSITSPNLETLAYLNNCRDLLSLNINGGRTNVSSLNSGIKEMKKLLSIEIAFTLATGTLNLMHNKQLASIRANSNNLDAVILPDPISGVDDPTPLSTLFLYSNNISEIQKLNIHRKHISLLNISQNQLTDLDFHEFENLVTLDVSRNNLTSLILPTLDNNLVGTSRLDVLKAGYNTDLDNISLSGVKSNLEQLSMGSCNISSIDVTNMPLASSILLEDNHLTGLDFTGLSSLKYLYLNNNKFKTIKFNGNCPELKTLELEGNELTSLDFVAETKTVTLLKASNNYLPDIDLSFLTAGSSIERLYLDNCSLTSININTKFNHMGLISLQDNPLSSIDLTGFPALTTVFLEGTEISSFDFPSLAARRFDVNFEKCNKLVYIDSSNFPNNNNKFEISVWLAGTSLDGNALDHFFGTLKTVVGNSSGVIYLASVDKDIPPALGVNDCDITIATNKGWSVVR